MKISKYIQILFCITFFFVLVYSMSPTLERTDYINNVLRNPDIYNKVTIVKNEQHYYDQCGQNLTITDSEGQLIAYSCYYTFSFENRVWQPEIPSNFNINAQNVTINNDKVPVMLSPVVNRQMQNLETVLLKSIPNSVTKVMYINHQLVIFKAYTDEMIIWILIDGITPFSVTCGINICEVDIKTKCAPGRKVRVNVDNFATTETPFEFNCESEYEDPTKFCDDNPYAFNCQPGYIKFVVGVIISIAILFMFTIVWSIITFIVWILSFLFRPFFQIFLWMSNKPVSPYNRFVNNIMINHTSRLKPKDILSTIIMFMCLITICDASSCGSIQVIGNGNYTVSTNYDIDDPNSYIVGYISVIQGASSGTWCGKLSGPENQQIQLSIEPVNIMKRATAIFEYNSPESYSVETYQIHRCLGAGPCGSGACSSQKTNDRTMAGQFTDSCQDCIGLTTCVDACGGLGCGCPVSQDPGCIWCMWALNTSREPDFYYRITGVSESYDLSVNITFPNGTSINAINPRKIDNFPIYIDSTKLQSITDYPIVGQYLIRRKGGLANYISSASSRNYPIAGMPGEIQASDSTSITNRSPNSMIFSKDMVTIIQGVRDCSFIYDAKSAVDRMTPNMKLPQRFSNDIWNVVSGSLIGVGPINSNMINTLNFNPDYKYQLVETPVCPVISNIYIRTNQCMSCTEGVTFEIEVRSSCGPGTAKLYFSSYKFTPQPQGIILTDNAEKVPITVMTDVEYVDVDVIIETKYKRTSIRWTQKLILKTELSSKEITAEPGKDVSPGSGSSFDFWDIFGFGGFAGTLLTIIMYAGIAFVIGFIIYKVIMMRKARNVIKMSQPEVKKKLLPKREFPDNNQSVRKRNNGD